MVSIIKWQDVLVPGLVKASPVSMTRSGGPSLAGTTESVTTDVGWWSFQFGGIGLFDLATRRAYNATRVSAKGRAGVLEIPVWSQEGNGWPPDSIYGRYLVLHSDDTPFDDLTQYEQPALGVILDEALVIGDVVAKLRVNLGPSVLSGIRWSYNGALYETGLALDIDDDVWTVPIFPAVRANIPAEAELETVLPTCLVHLATDREMDGSFSSTHFDLVTVNFEEAHDYWSNLAEEG